jgi:hypothetical protein
VGELKVGISALTQNRAEVVEVADHPRRRVCSLQASHGDKNFGRKIRRDRGKFSLFAKQQFVIPPQGGTGGDVTAE